MVTVADSAAAVEGINVTLIAQLVFAPTEVPQLFVSLKSPLFAPVIVMLEMVRGPPLSLIVTLLAALVVPSTCLPKSRLDGEIAAFGGKTKKP